MRPKQVVPRALARRDIEEAADWLRRNRGPEAVRAFLASLSAAFDHIGRHPAAGSLRYAELLDLPGLRFWPLRRQPYLAFYVERSDHVDLWRIYHNRRDLLRELAEPGEPDGA